MENVFYSLHDFMFRTESITYIIVVVALIGLPLFWRFLTARDKNDHLGADTESETH
jgi:hypothetical protein